MIPKVTLIMAMSADGYITKHEDGFVDWSSTEDKKNFKRLTKEAGAVIFGKKTFDTFGGKPLPGRLNIVMTRTPVESDNEDLMYTDLSPRNLLEELAGKGFKTVALGGGSEINKLFFEAGLVDEIYLTIEPMFFGSGRRMIAESMLDVPLKLEQVSTLNDNTVLLHYSVIKL